MNTMNALVWLFPVLFMIHDFEEILLISEWRRKHAKELEGAGIKKTPFSDFISTAAFSFAVAEEFILFSLVTFHACISGNYILWYGLFFATVFHFLPHLAFSIKLKRFVPGAATSALFLPAGIYILYTAAEMTGYSPLVLSVSSIGGIILLFFNLIMLHRLMPRFDRWIRAV